MAGKDSGTIQTRLQLDGEQQYKKALNDAYRSLRVLKSELKAETAELGKNATAQEKNSKKAESLRKQIAEQEKIVQTLAQALKDSQQEYADNQEVQDKWAEKLNKAREALARMKDELETASSGLGNISDDMREVRQETANASVEALSLSSAFNSIGDIAGSIGSNLTSIASSVYDTVKEMVDGMISLMSQAWSAAGDWNQIQSMYGGSLESIEMVMRGMSLQDVSASDVTSGVQKLLGNLDNEDTKAALKKIHEEESKYTSHWEHYVGVMEKLSMYKGQDRDELVRAIFGDKAGSAQLDVVNNWRDAMNKYQTDIEGTGMVLSDKQITQLDTVSHQVHEIDALWKEIQTNMGAKLTEILNVDEIDEDVLDILRDVGTLLNADDAGTKAEITMKLDADIKKLIADIETAMTSLSTYLNSLAEALKNSDSPILQFFGKLIDALSGILDWVAEHGDQIIAALEKLLPTMIANKVVEATTGKGVGEWGSDIIKTLLQVTGIKKILGAVGGSAAGSAAGGAAAATAGGGWLTGIWNSITGLTAKGASALGGAGTAPIAVGDWFMNQTEIGRAFRDGTDVLEAAANTWGRLAEKFGEENLKDFSENWDIHGENANPIAKGIGWLGDQWGQNGANTARFWEGVFGDVSDWFGGLVTVDDSDAERQAVEAEMELNNLLEQQLLDAMELNNQWNSQLDESIGNLLEDKYTGDREEEKQEITIEVTANTYVDGALVAQSVDRHLFGGGGSWRAVVQ